MKPGFSSAAELNPDNPKAVVFRMSRRAIMSERTPHVSVIKHLCLALVGGNVISIYQSVLNSLYTINTATTRKLHSLVADHIVVYRNQSLFVRYPSSLCAYRIKVA